MNEILLSSKLTAKQSKMKKIHIHCKAHC